MAEAGATPVAELSFEAALAELEQVVARLEVGQVPLEESIALYARGAELRAHCEEQAEGRRGAGGRDRPRARTARCGAGRSTSPDRHGRRRPAVPRGPEPGTRPAPRRRSTGCCRRRTRRSARRCATRCSSGGKRLRAFLALESAAMFRVPPAQALRTAAAVECIHAYSLVHDDLPCMDDDDLRRGQPTVHVKWDEATAVLAGDALQTLAFEILAAPQGGIDPRLQVRLIAAAGAGGGRAGHGRRPGARHRRRDRGGAARPRADHRPAGAEDRGAVRLGGGVRARSSAGRTPSRCAAMPPALGLAFQIRDDILDVEGDPGGGGQAAAQGRGARARRPSSRCSGSTARGGKARDAGGARPATLWRPTARRRGTCGSAAQFVSRTRRAERPGGNDDDRRATEDAAARPDRAARRPQGPVGRRAARRSPTSCAPRRSRRCRVTGGHLGAGLGVVELTVAIHAVFNTPKDKLIWDVGHQCYPHKILTGRRDRIRTLRAGRRALGLHPARRRAPTTRSARRIPRPRSRRGSASPWRATSARRTSATWSA